MAESESGLEMFDSFPQSNDPKYTDQSLRSISGEVLTDLLEGGPISLACGVTHYAQSGESFAGVGRQRLVIRREEDGNPFGLGPK
jgi:hypothetical protein